MADFTSILASRMPRRPAPFSQQATAAFPFWTPDLVPPPLPAFLTQLARMGAFRHYGFPTPSPRQTPTTSASPYGSFGA